MHQLLKLRYFLDSNYMQSKLGSAPSYTWCGIWKAKVKSILHEGCCWRVGDGKPIYIWEDSWVPGLRQISSRNLTVQDQYSADTIDTLIDNATQCRNVEKVNRSYHPKSQWRYSKFHYLQRPNRIQFSRKWKNEVCIAFRVPNGYARKQKNRLW